MKLSIILPVYNVEHFIESALCSIYGQNVPEDLFEVVVVNDGTPDNSMSIVNKFIPSHKNLIVLEQKNQGLSAARNTGMKIASGDYVWFVDSDDTITDNSLLKIMSLISDHSDIEIFCFDYNEIKNKQIKNVISIFTKESYSCYYNHCDSGYFYNRKLPIGLVQRFLFSHDFLKKHDLEFTPGIYHEDLDFLVRCYVRAVKVLPLNYKIYNYNLRESGSITTTFNMKRFDDMLSIVRNFRKWSQCSKNNKAVTIYENGIFSLCYDLLLSPYSSQSEYRHFLKTYKAELKSYLLTSYLKSLSKNSFGKTLRLFKSLLV